MLKCTLERKNDIYDMMADGSLDDIITEYLSIAHWLYNEVLKNDPTIAELLKAKITLTLIDPESPVWEIDHDGEEEQNAEADHR